jgi:hypothetical protein
MRIKSLHVRREKKRKTEIWSPYEPDAGKITGTASKTAGGLHGVNMSTVKNCCVNQYYLKYHHGTDTQGARLPNSNKLKDFNQNIQKKVSFVREYPVLHVTRLMKTSTHCAVLI